MHFISETKSVTPNILAFLTQITHNLTAVKIKRKIYRLENVCANVLNNYDHRIMMVFRHLKQVQLKKINKRTVK